MTRLRIRRRVWVMLTAYRPPLSRLRRQLPYKGSLWRGALLWLLYFPVNTTLLQSGQQILAYTLKILVYI